jgi:hypothetical protein
MFLILMCLIVYNLFIGIAVSDINVVLSEADIQFISLRIQYVLTVQSITDPLFRRSKLLNRLFGMNFQHFTKEHDFITKGIERFEKFKKIFTKKGGKILLSDPQQRIEEELKKISKSSDNDNQSIEKLLKLQLESIETRFANSNKQIQSTLLELRTNTSSNFENVRNELNRSSKNVSDNLKIIDQNITESLKNISKSETKIAPIQIIEPIASTIEVTDKESIDSAKYEEMFTALENNLSEKFSTVDTRLNDIQFKFENEVTTLKSQINFFIKSLNESLKSQTTEIQNAMFLSETSVRTDLNESVKITGRGIALFREKATSLENKFDRFQNEFNELKQSIFSMNQS